MRRLVVLALIAVAAGSLGANRSSAASTPPVASSISTVLSSNSSDLGSLFNAVTLTATSVSLTSNLGVLSISTQTDPSTNLKQVILVAGDRPPVVIRLDPYRPTPPSSRPIPEASSLLLYALGSLGIGWVVLRSRKTASPHLA